METRRLVVNSDGLARQSDLEAIGKWKEKQDDWWLWKEGNVVAWNACQIAGRSNQMCGANAEIINNGKGTYLVDKEEKNSQFGTY